MHEYKFVRVELGGVITQQAKEDHQQIIHDHAQQGWRLVQIFAPPFREGLTAYLEIIFERPTPEASA